MSWSGSINNENILWTSHSLNIIDAYCNGDLLLDVYLCTTTQLNMTTKYTGAITKQWLDIYFIISNGMTDPFQCWQVTLKSWKISARTTSWYLAVLLRDWIHWTPSARDTMDSCHLPDRYSICNKIPIKKTYNTYFRYSFLYHNSQADCQIKCRILL